MEKKKRVTMIGIVWTAVAALFLIAQATSWAVEAEAPQMSAQKPYPFQLLRTERVMDSNPAAPGVQGNSLPNLQRWNAILFQASLVTLRQQGPGVSPTGRVTAPESQRIESRMGRIE